MGVALLQFNQAELVQLDMEGMSQVPAGGFWGGGRLAHGMCFGVGLSRRTSKENYLGPYLSRALSFGVGLAHGVKFWSGFSPWDVFWGGFVQENIPGDLFWAIFV